MEDMVVVGSSKMAKALWRFMVLSLSWTIWIERNCRIFEKEMGIIDIFEKAKFLASLWPSTDKGFKDIPFHLIILSWKDPMGRWRVVDV